MSLQAKQVVSLIADMIRCKHSVELYTVSNIKLNKVLDMSTMLLSVLIYFSQYFILTAKMHLKNQDNTKLKIFKFVCIFIDNI